MRKQKQKVSQQLLVELESLEHMGITIWIDGVAGDAKKVAEELSLREESNYMRDYVLNDEGDLQELRFDKIW